MGRLLTIIFRGTCPFIFFEVPFFRRRNKTHQNNPRKEDLEKTVAEVLDETSELFEEIWDSLTLNQRRVLVAIARGEEDFYSRDFLTRYGFERASTVQAAIRSLREKELIVKEGEKYLVEKTPSSSSG